MKDLYYILGVDKNATPAQIDVAYTVLSAKLKPTPGENELFLQNHFSEITDAYSVLSNPGKRKAYDATLKRAHLRQLSRFKAKTTNSLIVVAVLLVTGLFGFYLVNLINSHNAPKKTVVAEQPVVAQSPKKHHKHRHHIKSLIAKRSTETNEIKIAASKPELIAPKPAKISADTIKKLSVKPMLVTVAKPVVKRDTVKAAKVTVVPLTPIKHLILVKSTTERDSSYITYLKNNLRDSVYMHQLADYMSPVVTVLPANSKVRVLEKGRIFYKVALAKGTGYIPKWSLAKP